MIAALFALINFGSPNVASAGFDLKGTVTDSNDQPLADVVVAIYTARPRVGVGML